MSIRSQSKKKQQFNWLNDCYSGYNIGIQIGMKVAHGYIKVMALCHKEVELKLKTQYIFRKINKIFNKWPML